MRTRLGEILVASKAVTAEQLQAALKSQVQFGGRVGTNLIEAGVVSFDVLAQALAQQQRVAAALEKHFQLITPQVIAMLPQKIAQRQNAVPLGISLKPVKTLYVAFVEPTLAAIDEVSFATGCRVTPTIAAELQVQFFLEKYYGVGSPGTELEFAL